MTYGSNRAQSPRKHECLRRACKVRHRDRAAFWSANFDFRYSIGDRRAIAHGYREKQLFVVSLPLRLIAFDDRIGTPHGVAICEPRKESGRAGCERRNVIGYLLSHATSLGTRGTFSRASVLALRLSNRKHVPREINKLLARRVSRHFWELHLCCSASSPALARLCVTS